MTFIDRCLKQNGHRLYSTYQILEEAHRTHHEAPLYNKIKLKRNTPKVYTRETIQAQIQNAKNEIAVGQIHPYALGQLPMELEVLEELAAAWRLKDKEDAKRQAAVELELAEEENVRKAEAEGTMSECACCCVDFPLNRMVHCDSPKVLHWFCRGCALTSAETEIGKSKYELVCMSMDGCTAGFSMEQR
jgi:TRIAD3 protein (E3 ubiquitin-protein ligase RNF216)